MKKINSHIYQQPHSYYFILTHTQTHIEQNKLKNIQQIKKTRNPPQENNKNTLRIVEALNKHFRKQQQQQQQRQQ